MLYRIFKWLFFLTVKGYFRSIYLEGAENIPEKGPMILVANHTSAFMDPILLATHIKRPLYFLARGESFKSKLVSIVFSWLHMIPIYRPDITPDEVHKNKQIFQRCFDHLAAGKSIMIFPEGFSKTERRLRPIKTGTARIALGAENQNDFRLGIKIVPIGINYSNPHYFQSDVYVRFGDPIEVRMFGESYINDPTEAVEELTDLIKSRLEHLTVVVRNMDEDQLVADVERLFKISPNEVESNGYNLKHRFYRSKEIVRVIEYFRTVKPKKAEDFKNKISGYYELLDRIRISDGEIVANGESPPNLRGALFFILGFPIFAYGYLANIVPYTIAKMLSKKIIVRKDFVGSMKLAFGMFVFLVFYIIFGTALNVFINWYWALLFLVSFYLSGLFTIYYLNRYFRWRKYQKFVWFKRNKKKLVRRLEISRKELVDQWDAIYNSFTDFDLGKKQK